MLGLLSLIEFDSDHLGEGFAEEMFGFVGIFGGVGQAG